MYSHDQVPIFPVPKPYQKTENKSVAEVYDCANSNKGAYQFCTLNLAGPMKLRHEKLNLTKAYLVFQVSRFREGKDLEDKDEVFQWYPRVIVSF